MSRPTRPRRFLTLLLAAMQFAAPAFVSVVDGAVTRAGQNGGQHIEAFGGNRCQPQHSANCLLCQFLSTTLVQAGRPAPAPVPNGLAQALTKLVVLRGTVTRHGFDSRAPPPLLV